MIVPEGATRVRRITLPPFLPGILLAAVGAFFLIYAFFLYNSFSSRVNLVESQMLGRNSRSQQIEIPHFAQKIAFMEEQAKKLLEMEGQVRKELKEINEMKRTTRISPAIPLKKPHLIGRTGLCLPEEQILIHDKERARLVSHLHQELLDLRKQAIQREHNLKEMGEYLRAQKSILAATPSLWPVLGRITSRFGETRQVFSSGGTKPHRGLDIAAPAGTAILAPADGVVRFAGWGLQYGRFISIDHGYGFSTMYGHLQEFSVKTGSKVKKGQMIGKVGLSGKTNGPHLHYVLCLHGNPVNPAPFLTQRP